MSGAGLSPKVTGTVSHAILHVTDWCVLPPHQPWETTNDLHLTIIGVMYSHRSGGTYLRYPTIAAGIAGLDLEHIGRPCTNPSRPLVPLDGYNQWPLFASEAWLLQVP